MKIIISCCINLKQFIWVVKAQFCNFITTHVTTSVAALNDIQSREIKEVLYWNDIQSRDYPEITSGCVKENFLPSHVNVTLPTADLREVTEPH